MGTINEIFRTYGPHYLQRYGQTMPQEHKKVIAALLRCRTEEGGSTVYHCERCGQPHVVHRSCGNRHCPGCQNHKSRQWLERQLARQLPGHHFLLTFTVPQQLRPFLRSHPRIGYAALFAASSGAIKTLAADPRFIGGDRPGFFGVLHTWGRQLQYHPHIHYVVPGGALSSQSGRWHSARLDFYLPVQALSKIFRARFRHRIQKAGLLNQIPPEVWGLEWNVNSQAVGNSETSLKYLAPYVFRVAITNRRIVKVEDDQVFFRYQKPHSNRLRTLALDALEFLRRFLQHVLPTGFMKVRHYGFLSPSSKVSLEEVRARIEIAYGFALPEPVREPDSPPPWTLKCPQCGTPLTYRFSIPPLRRVQGVPSG
ncbi:MAG: transposase [candidate division NC10 bacterium]|nr:transposase [candidate division NC10 bacterium]